MKTVYSIKQLRAVPYGEFPVQHKRRARRRYYEEVKVHTFTVNRHTLHGYRILLENAPANDGWGTREPNLEWLKMEVEYNFPIDPL